LAQPFSLFSLMRW